MKSCGFSSRFPTITTVYFVSGHWNDDLVDLGSTPGRVMQKTKKNGTCCHLA